MNEGRNDLVPTLQGHLQKPGPMAEVLSTSSVTGSSHQFRGTNREGAGRDGQPLAPRHRRQDPGSVVASGVSERTGWEGHGAPPPPVASLLGLPAGAGHAQPTATQGLWLAVAGSGGGTRVLTR